MAWIESRETKRGKRYWVYWKVGSKKYCRKAGPYKESAYKIRLEIEKSLIENGSEMNPNRSIEFVGNEFIKFSSKTNKPKTVKFRKYILEKLYACFGKDRRIRDISLHDIQTFKTKTLEKHSMNGLSSILKAVRTIFNYAKQYGYLVNDPTLGILKDVKQKPVARFLTKDEIDKVLSCAVTEEVKEAILVSLYTGMRAGEIAALHSDYVRNGYIEIPVTKTGTPRVIPIHPAIKHIIGRNGKIIQLSRAYTDLQFRITIKRANIGRIRFHDLRHTFCSQYLKNGGTIADLRMISGHEDLDSLKRYAHFQNSYLEERIGCVQY